MDFGASYRAGPGSIRAKALTEGQGFSALWVPTRRDADSLGADFTGIDLIEQMIRVVAGERKMDVRIKKSPGLDADRPASANRADSSD